MMKKYILLIILIFGFISIGFTQTRTVGTNSSSDKVIKLSLKDAIQSALELNRTLQIAKLKSVEQKAVTEQVRSGYLPQVNLSLSQSRQKINYSASGFSGTGFPTSSTFDSFEGALQLSQVIFDRSLQKSIRIAKEQENTAESDYSATQEAVTLQVISLYLQALRSESRLKASRARLEAADALLTQASQFEEAGTGSKLETARAELQYMNEWQLYSETSAEFEISKLNLAQFINLDQGVEIDLTDKPQFESMDLISMDSAIQTGFTNRPDLISEKTKLVILGLSISKARSLHFPVLGLFGELARTGEDFSDNDDAYAIGISMTMPLFTGGNIQGQVHQARAQWEQQKMNVTELESQIELDIRKAYISLEAAAKQVNASRQGVQSAEITLRLTRSRYSEGISTNLEVVDSQDTLARAQENEIRALYNFNIARANLAKAMGKIQEMYDISME